MSWQVPRHCVSVSGDPVREKRNGDGRRHQDWRPANCKIVAAATKDSFGAENLQCLYVQLVCTFSYTSANSFNFQTYKIAKETLYTKPVTFFLLLVIMVLLSSVAYNSAMVLPWHSKWGKIINDLDSSRKDRELLGEYFHAWFVLSRPKLLPNSFSASEGGYSLAAWCVCEKVINQTEDHRYRVLLDCAANVRVWNIKVRFSLGCFVMHDLKMWTTVIYLFT